jgi:hypothetical protein
VSSPYAPQPFVAGSLVTSTAKFYNAAGDLADPNVITLQYRQGYATTVTVTYPAAPITRADEGVYQADFDTSGFTGPDNQLWTVQWSGTGNVQAVAVSYWTVVPAPL